MSELTKRRFYNRVHTHTPSSITLTKREFANKYKQQILDLYHILQNRVDNNIKWDKTTLLSFIDLIFENSSGYIYLNIYEITQ